MDSYFLLYHSEPLPGHPGYQHQLKASHDDLNNMLALALCQTTEETGTATLRHFTLYKADKQAYGNNFVQWINSNGMPDKETHIQAIVSRFGDKIICPAPDYTEIVYRKLHAWTMSPSLLEPDIVRGNLGDVVTVLDSHPAFGQFVNQMRDHHLNHTANYKGGSGKVMFMVVRHQPDNDQTPHQLIAFSEHLSAICLRINSLPTNVGIKPVEYALYMQNTRCFHPLKSLSMLDAKGKPLPGSEMIAMAGKQSGGTLFLNRQNQNRYCNILLSIGINPFTELGYSYDRIQKVRAELNTRYSIPHSVKILGNRNTSRGKKR